MKPAIADEAYSSITAETVQRAGDLDLTPFGDPGQYYVTGGSSEHYVDLFDPELDRCDCEDHLWRSRICKHVVAALMVHNDARLMARIRELLADS